MPILIYFLSIKYQPTHGLLGLWLSKTLIDSALSLSYIFVLFRYDWHDVAARAIKRIAD